MKKYVLYIDYLTEMLPKTIEYKELEAKTIMQAIEEADELHDSESMYLVRIMIKQGKQYTQTIEGNGWTEKQKVQNYTPIMEKRCHWHEYKENNIWANVSHIVSSFGDWWN